MVNFIFLFPLSLPLLFAVAVVVFPLSHICVKTAILLTEKKEKMTHISSVWPYFYRFSISTLVLFVVNLGLDGEVSYTPNCNNVVIEKGRKEKAK